MKIGDQYELYGRGLAYYSFQDQNIDYDNSLYGFQASYVLSDAYNLFILAGKKNVLSR